MNHSAIRKVTTLIVPRMRKRGTGCSFFDGMRHSSGKKAASGAAARGFTLIEMFFYIAILVILVIAVIQALVPLSRSFRTMSANASVQTTAQTALERMVREARDATSIDLATSTLGSSPGQLQLNTTDSSGNVTTVQFYMSGQTIRMKKAGVDAGPLTPTDAKVTNLVFRKITTSNSQAVKIELTVESGSGASYQSKSFYSTIVLRNSYPSQ